jgi:magnesium-transporting ATPase (P-type)
VEYIARFAFDAALQRSSVVVKFVPEEATTIQQQLQLPQQQLPRQQLPIETTETAHVFVKGSPEAMARVRA